MNAAADKPDLTKTHLTKTDLKKTLDTFRARQGELRLLELPPTRYLMVDGEGDPNTAQEYADALAALYPAAYALKFASKRELGRDYVVPPLEALWWADDMSLFTTARDKSTWRWTAMIMVPDWVETDLVDAAIDTARAKASTSRHSRANDSQPSPALDLLRHGILHEGLCVQTLHVGAYDDEGPVLEEIHERFLPEHGLTLTGRHHEIYLSDSRRVTPARLRTILRQPVTRG